MQKTTYITREQVFQTECVCVTIAQIKKHNVTSKAPFYVPFQSFPTTPPLLRGFCSDLKYHRLIFLFLKLVQMETYTLGSSFFFLFN